MKLVDKLFGKSRIHTLGKLHYQNRAGESVTISKDLRYTIQDVKDHCKKYGYTPVL